MTAAGTLTAISLGLGLLVWVVTLVRQDRLYAGYGVIFVLGTLAAVAVVIVLPLRRVATALSLALLPEPALSALAIVIFTFLIVYVFIQISVLSNRITKLTRELAIRDAEPRDRAPSDRDGSR